MNHTLSLCMIVKNESKNLPRCLASVAGLADEIIIADTGSTDDTVQIAQKLGAKIYYYPWNQNFSDARNFAISKATGSWVLLLDADEKLEKADHPKVRELMQDDSIDGAHFTIYNYMGAEVSDNCTLHNGFRLLRNSGQYCFEGEIHEQITRRDKKEATGKLPITDIKIYHYGYMDNQAAAQQKRLRNIPILKKQLENRPKDPFVLFNLGNEYLAMNSHTAALEVYTRAFAEMDSRRAYAPHLIRRMVYCHQHLKQYDQALALVAQGLALYPACTDYEYARADIYQITRRYTMAIESLQRCLEMGEAPPPLRFTCGCGGDRASLSLGELYFKLGDYPKAIGHFNRVLTQAPGRYGVLYRIGAALCRLFPNEQEARDRLYQYFAESQYPPNVIVASDILLEQGVTAPVAPAIAGNNTEKEYPDDFCYLSAKHAFLTGQFEPALQQFKELLAREESPAAVLPGIRKESAKYAFAAALALGKEAPMQLLELVRKHCGNDYYKICLQCCDLQIGGSRRMPALAQTGEAGLAMALDLLNRLLKAGQLGLFERLLPILELFENKAALLRLAEVYQANMAVQTVLRSIKELDTLDERGAEILWRHLR